MGVIAFGATFFLKRSPDGRPTVPAAGSGMAASALHSIAVLPFVNMSGSKEKEYLGDGISEEIINALARDGHLLVVSRTSAFAFKGQNLDAREIGRKLGVDAILEGSVRQAGSRLRVTAQLIDAANGYHLWSQAFDRDSADIFAIQDEISRTIVTKLEPSAAVPAAAGAPPTANLKAYDLFLRGRYAMSGWETEGLRTAEGCLERSVRLDPDFGAAWAALAETLILQHEMHGIRERDEAYAKATDAAERAIAASRPAGEGHAALAHILAHHGNLAGCLFSEGRPAEALQEIGRAHELGFRNLESVSFEVLALVQLKRPDDAMKEIDRARDLPGAKQWLEIDRAYVYAASGRKSDALPLLSAAGKEFLPPRSEGFVFLPLVYVAMGEREAAITWFQRLGRAGAEGLGWMRFLPDVRPLLTDPRMQAILRSGGYLD